MIYLTVDGRDVIVADVITQKRKNDILNPPRYLMHSTKKGKPTPVYWELPVWGWCWIDSLSVCNVVSRKTCRLNGSTGSYTTVHSLKSRVQYQYRIHVRTHPNSRIQHRWQTHIHDWYWNCDIYMYHFHWNDTYQCHVFWRGKWKYHWIRPNIVLECVYNETIMNWLYIIK